MKYKWNGGVKLIQMEKRRQEGGREKASDWFLGGLKWSVESKLG